MLSAKSNVVAVRFQVQSGADVLKSSHVRCSESHLFKNGLPVVGGLCDGHLGTTDHAYTCQSCHNPKQRCLGHSGHINLNYPVQSPMFMSKIKEWLRLICFKCGNTIMHDSELVNLPADSRLNKSYKLIKSLHRACPTCGEMHPFIKFDKDNSMMFIAEVHGEKEAPVEIRRLYPHTIETIFERVTDETVKRLGVMPVSHPSKFILRHINVPPTAVRPDVRRSIGSKGTSDPLTMILQNIIRSSAQLPAVTPSEIDVKMETLIYDLNVLYYSLIKGPKGKQGTSVPLMSLAKRISTKLGRLRQHLLGKRVFRVGRTTIVGDPTVPIDSLGVPISFARRIQIAEVVQEYNLSRLTVNFMNGRAAYPGCTKIIKRRTGAEHAIDHNSNHVELEIGDTIFRDLQDGDQVLFNRQPSLVPSSISAHTIIVTMDPKNLTFRMNVLVCPLYNADFDGDEMNIFVPRGVASRCEMDMISGVGNWFIKHATGAPLIGEAEDSVIGSFALSMNKHATGEPKHFDKYHAMLLFNNNLNLPSFEDKSHTPNDIISKILEPTPIFYSAPTTFYRKEYVGPIDYDPKDIRLVINHGKHVSGVLDKRNIGKGAVGGLFHTIYNEFGAKATLRALFDLQQTAIGYTGQHNFSIGLTDIMFNKKATHDIDTITAGLIQQSKLITEQLIRGELVPPVNVTVAEYYERLQVAVLKVAEDYVVPVLSGIDHKTNGLAAMILSGSKGTINHLQSIGGLVGLVLPNGKRPSLNFAYQRGLPFFPRFDTSPEARGFVGQSYVEGVTAVSYFYIAMTARLNFISKALTTAVSGEIHRKTVKALDSLVVNINRMVVGGKNRISQLTYGEDGYDTRRVTKVTIPTIMLSDDQFASYKFVTPEAKYQAVFDDEFAQLQADRTMFRREFLRLEHVNVNEPLSDRLSVPIDVALALKTTLHKFGKAEPTTAEIAAMVKTVADYCAGLAYNHFNENYRAAKRRVPSYINTAVWSMKVVIRSVLCAAKSLQFMTPAMLDTLLQHINSVHKSALIAYGSTIGLIAAMSLSEPLVQFMLDAHHRQGGENKDVLAEVHEVLNATATDSLSMPMMTLMLDAEHTEDSALKVAHRIEVSKLLDYVVDAKIFYEKYGQIVHPDYLDDQKRVIESFERYNPLMKRPVDLISWCMRLTLNHSKMIYKHIQLETIITSLRDAFPLLHFIYSDENTSSVVIRVYVRAGFMSAHVEKSMMLDLLNKLVGTTVRGVTGVREAKVTTVVVTEQLADNSLTTAKRVAVQTVGTNIKDVLRIAAVDPMFVQTDSIMETFEVFGIEAARQRLISSIRNLGAGGLDHHHVTIFADEMTSTGVVTSIKIQGVAKRTPDQVLLRVGYSSPIQTLEESAANARIDHIEGVTAPMLIGSVPRDIGTAQNQCIMDEAFIAANTKQADSFLDEL